MKTVKEISELTGISIRALRYYDEIGLLVPTDRTDTGYRLYDDEADLDNLHMGGHKFENTPFLVQI